MPAITGENYVPPTTVIYLIFFFLILKEECVPNRFVKNIYILYIYT